MTGSAEFQLAVECCRRNFASAHHRPLPANVDWAGFLRLARFHRIEGLCHRALCREETVPAFVGHDLRQEAATIAARNLRSAAESRTILAIFSSAAVPVLFVKGQTLGALAYGDPALKSAIDIDLLIDPADLAEAFNCLRAAGFELVAPRCSSDRLQRWHRSWKESVWRSPSSAIQVDLHTRLADNPRLIPRVDVHSSYHLVSVAPTVALPTLLDDELLAYLAVHGASAAWFRLKWIADFAALLSRQTSGVEQIYERSQELGAGRAAGQALLLADALFGVLESHPALARRLGDDRRTRQLFDLAMSLLKREPAEPTERFLGTLPIHISQMLLLPGYSFGMSEIARRASQFGTRLSV